LRGFTEALLTKSRRPETDLMSYPRNCAGALSPTAISLNLQVSQPKIADQSAKKALFIIELEKLSLKCLDTCSMHDDAAHEVHCQNNTN
jgi:hypothetical protein